MNIDEQAQAWVYYQNLVRQHGFEGITDLLARHERLQSEVERKNEELAAFAGWYVTWEEQIPKIAKEAIEARLQRIADETTKGSPRCAECGEPTDEGYQPLCKRCHMGHCGHLPEKSND